MDNKPVYLRVKDIQKIVPLGKDTIYKLCQLDGFPSIRIGGTYMVEKTALIEWLKDHEGKRVNLP